MSDGDAYMHEGGEGAPTVSEVADKLQLQRLAEFAGPSVLAHIEENNRKERLERRRAAKVFADQTKLAETGKIGGEKPKDGTGADGAKNTGPGGEPEGFDPISAIVAAAKPGTEASSKPTAEGAGEHAGDPTEKGQRKRGKRKRGRGGLGAKPGPNRQQAAPVVNTRCPVEVPRGNGNHRIPNPDIRPNLSLPREQRKAEVDRRLAASNPPRPTRWDSLPEPSPRRSPPRRNDRRSPPRPALDDRRRQRTPSPVDRRPVPDDSKLLGFVAGALELIKERVLRV